MSPVQRCRWTLIYKPVNSLRNLLTVPYDALNSVSIVLYLIITSIFTSSQTKFVPDEFNIIWSGNRRLSLVWSEKTYKPWERNVHNMKDSQTQLQKHFCSFVFFYIIYVKCGYSLSCNTSLSVWMPNKMEVMTTSSLTVRTGLWVSVQQIDVADSSLSIYQNTLCGFSYLNITSEII